MRILKLKSGDEIQVRDHVFDFINSKYLKTGKDARIVLDENKRIKVWDIIDYSDQLDDSLMDTGITPALGDPVRQLRLILEKKGVLKK